MMDDEGLPSQNNLPLESGRALAVTFLESATGISTGLPALELLEGVISECSDDDSDDDTELGERFLESLPPSFLQEKALVLGRLGKHEDAVRILYRDLKSLDLALEYCDGRYERQRQALLSKQKQYTYNAVVTGATHPRDALLPFKCWPCVGAPLIVQQP